MFAAFNSIPEIDTWIDNNIRRIVLMRTTSGAFTELYVNGEFANIFHNNDVFARTVQYINSRPVELTGISTKIEHNWLEVVFP